MQLAETVTEVAEGSSNGRQQVLVVGRHVQREGRRVVTVPIAVEASRADSKGIDISGSAAVTVHVADPALIRLADVRCGLCVEVVVVTAAVNIVAVVFIARILQGKKVAVDAFKGLAVVRKVGLGSTGVGYSR